MFPVGSSLYCYRLEEDLQRMTIEPRARCVAQTIDLNVFGGASEGRTREQSFQWNPLNPEKMEEIMKEANKLAAQLKECRLLEKEPPTSFLHVERGSVRSSRRETFNVNDSPLKALLPTVKLETYSAPDSPRAAIAKERSPVHCTARSPIPKRLQNKQTNCSPDSQLSKNTSNSPKTLTTKKPLTTKKVQKQDWSLHRLCKCYTQEILNFNSCSCPNLAWVSRCSCKCLRGCVFMLVHNVAFSIS